MRIARHISELIGHTPLVQLNSVVTPGAGTVAAKNFAGDDAAPPVGLRAVLLPTRLHGQKQYDGAGVPLSPLLGSTHREPRL